MAALPRVTLVGASALALLGTAVLGLSGATSASAAAPRLSDGTVQAQPVVDDDPSVSVVDPTDGEALAAEALAPGGEPDSVSLEAAAVVRLTRAQEIARAKTWHPHTSERIPYSQSRTHGGYRTDCSGYASMALHLPTPGPNTVALATSTYTSPIAMSSLKKGDLVIDSTGDSNSRHVVIFEKWTSSTHRSYWAYEQRGGYGTDHRIISYGVASGSQYHARRPKNLTD